MQDTSRIAPAASPSVTRPPAKVLLIDGCPSRELGSELFGILHEAEPRRFQLRRENSEPSAGTGEGGLRELVQRWQPSMLFWVVPSDNPARMIPRLAGIHETFNRPIVIVSEAGEPAEVFEVLKHGAHDFITPPLKQCEILPRVWQVLEQERWQDNGAEPDGLALNGLIGKSAAFWMEARKIPLLAKSQANVLISGETGTGKEVFARAIHQSSERASGPFVPVNCGAIPVELVESEVFGHERGAFTGAVATRPGLIREAEGGTLFLDEIDSLPLLAQVKLLRFLQEKEYRPVGSAKTRTADVRVITATNVDMDEAVRAGKVRQDLYYRLNIVAIRLPALRERRTDIPVLAEHFLGRYSKQLNRNFSFSEDARRRLLVHNWPGNVRELEHAVDRAVALCQHPVIQSSDLALTSGRQSELESFHDAKARAVGDFERTYLEGLMLACRGNISHAADAARKNRRAFFELLRKHGIEAGRFRISS